MTDLVPPDSDLRLRSTCPGTDAGTPSSGTEVADPVDPCGNAELIRPGVHRFQAMACAVIAAAGVPYTWVLWDLWSGSINPLRTVNQPEAIYDVQARALMHGHITIPPGSIGEHAFVHGGRSYTYFGLFPSLLRMPVLIVTHSFDGRLTSLSMLLGWLTAAIFTALLLWRLRIVLRGEVVLGWVEVTSYGILLFSILAGSGLLYLASQPDVFSEDLTWSVALACGCLFVLVGLLERPSRGRVVACGLLVLLTNLNRATTGYALLLATLGIAGWFATGRAGADRRRWALPTAMAAVMALLVGCAVDWAKFHLLVGIPLSEELLVRAFELNQRNGGHYFGLRYLPSTLQAYIDPSNIRVTPVFPYLTLPDVPSRLIAHTRLFTRAPTAAVPPSTPLLVGMGLCGVVAALRPHQQVTARGLRILLLAGIFTASSVMVYGWVVERFVADFLPLLILASMIGAIEVFRLIDRRTRGLRIVVTFAIAVLAAIEFAANLGIAVTPVFGWTQTQVDHYVTAEKAFSSVTGHPLSHEVIFGSSFPVRASMGQLFVKGNCAELYISTGATPPGIYDANFIWLPVERAPKDPICRSFLHTAAMATHTGISRPTESPSAPGTTMGRLARGARSSGDRSAQPPD